MSKEKLIREEIARIELYDLDGKTIQEFYDYVLSFVEAYPDYSDIRVKAEYYDDDAILTLAGSRPETEKERNQRLAQVKKIRANNKKHKALEEKSRYKEFVKLFEEFEGKPYKEGNI